MSKERKTHFVKTIAREAGKVAINHFFKRDKKRRRTKMKRGKRNPGVRRRAEIAYNVSERNKQSIKQMKCFIDQRTAVHIHRIRRSGATKAGNRNKAYSVSVIGGCLSCHETAAGNLRYYDPNTDALVTRSAVAGTYNREICMSIARKITVRNNYQVPCRVKVFSCVPKAATDIATDTAYTNGLTDQGAPSVNSPLMHFTDSHDLKNLWTVKMIIDRTLQAGQTAVGHSASKRFDYTVSTNDAETAAYQRKQGGHNFFIEVNGVISHDSGGAAEYLVQSAGVDWMVDVTYRFEYDAGKDLHDYSLDDSTAVGFTTNGVLSARPLVDNQSYSVA